MMELGVQLIVILLASTASALSPGVTDNCSGDSENCDSLQLPPHSQYTDPTLHAPNEQNKHPIICKGQSRPVFQKEPQQFQPVPERPIKVFSAFYDGRPEADGPSVRVVGVGLQAAYNDIGDLYCILWYPNSEEGLATGRAKYEFIYPSTGHPDMWVSHFIRCPLALENGILPFAVSITNAACGDATNQLKVLNTEEIKKTDTHALCISPIYGKFDEWKEVIEIIEIHKLLGAKEITVYNLSVSAATNNVLQSYSSDATENVNVIQWPFPSLKSNVWGQRAALNDCLYRMGHYHKYVTITDMDEILVPRMVETWPALIKIIDSPKRGIFMFQHAYFRRNATGDEPYLFTQQSLWRTNKVVPPGKIRCKSMYKAERAVSIDLHFAYHLTPETEEYMLDPSEGILHHFRRTPMESFRKNPDHYTFIQDDYMKRFKQRLLEATSKRIDLVNTNT